jgi:SAM-dependent methyltransferase
MTHSEENEAVLRMRRQVSELARGYRAAQVLLTCVELGVFEAIAAGASTETEIAAAISCDARGTSLLLNAAVALGLLAKRASHFANTPLAATCLAPDGAGYMAGSLRLESAFYRRWGRLKETVRTGQRPEENARDEQAGDWVANFVHGLYDMARPIAPFIAEALALAEDRPLRAIDVGGGHGAYSLALARRYPLLTATVFELPRVVAVAREIIAQAGLANRVTVQEGDFQREELGCGYDVALLFGVLNGEPPKGRPALIRKIFAALNPGGRIVLRDFVLDPDRAGPPDATLFALQMLLATDAGGLDTSDDWARWLVAAGFAPPHTLALPGWIGATLTVAEKPQIG